MSDPNINIENLLHNKHATDMPDDMQVVSDVIDHYQAQPLSPDAKEKLWQNAQHQHKHRAVSKWGERVSWLAVASLIAVLGIFGFYMLPTDTITNPAVQQSIEDAMLFDAVPTMSDAFGFEYGVYTPIMPTIDATSDLQEAGAQWVASHVIFRTDEPDQLQAIEAQIETAHSQGFKILFTVQGVFEFPINPDAYYQQYADFLGQIASSGADAIEIWSEPNIDRAFPREYLGAEHYAELLTVTIPAIREANRDTLIISGAPAPTGAAFAFPDQIINDNDFLRELYDMGVLDDVDCVGMHYMEGAVPPLATSGDTRDNYYTRYLPTQLQTYRMLVSAEIPFCITELGYFAGENMPDIPTFFEWANTTSRDEQQQWTREALEWLSLQADVRLAIVWHLNLGNMSPERTAYNIGADTP
ncbi:MAG: hypothetical protein AAF126_11300 [Chloroflexota bacterium]